MVLSKPLKVVASSIALWVGVEVSYLMWLGVKKACRRDYGSVEDNNLSVDPFNTVLFFDSGSPECFVSKHNSDECERKNCSLRNMRLISTLLESAKTSIDICMYKLTSPALAVHLKKAIKNGARVRVLSHGKVDEHSGAITSLQQCGAYVRGKEYESHLLMHHKFVVVDNSFVITGSLNWTTTAVSGNWEDAAIMLEPCFVKKFSDEFQYLWDNFKTAADRLPTPVNLPIFPSNMSVWKENPFHEVFLFREDTAACRAHMSSLKFERQPPDHVPICAYRILHNLAELLGTAEKSIDVCQLLINLENIADVFLGAFYQGLKVRVVSDTHMANCSGSQIRSLINAGIEVRGKHYHSSMHHKFIILDQKFVLFGSFNWTMQALCGNSESLVCTNNDVIVNKFRGHFDEMWEEFEPMEVDKIGLRRFTEVRHLYVIAVEDCRYEQVYSDGQKSCPNSDGLVLSDRDTTLAAAVEWRVQVVGQVAIMCNPASDDPTI